MDIRAVTYNRNCNKKQQHLATVKNQPPRTNTQTTNSQPKISNQQPTMTTQHPTKTPEANTPLKRHNSMGPPCGRSWSTATGRRNPSRSGPGPRNTNLSGARRKAMMAMMASCNQQVMPPRRLPSMAQGWLCSGSGLVKCDDASSIDWMNPGPNSEFGTGS